MQIELKSLQREVGITFIFVTHDQEEAMALSDRIALLRAGNLEQVAEPREIYARPATAYTAQFIGQTNLLQAELRNGYATSSGIIWKVAPVGPEARSASPPASDDLGARSMPDSFAAHPVPNTPVGDGACSALRRPRRQTYATPNRVRNAATFSLRPECIHLANTSSSSAPNNVRFAARITNQTFGGATDLLEVALSDGRTLRVRIPSRGILDGPQQFEFTSTDAIRVQDLEPS